MFFRKKGKIVYYHLFDVKTEGDFISAKMLKVDFEKAIKEEKQELLVIVEDGVEILYLGTPIGAYRVTIVDEP